MKIFREHEVSDDQILCKSCSYSFTRGWCKLFKKYRIQDSMQGWTKCYECTEASKKAPLCNSTGKVCQCTCK